MAAINIYVGNLPYRTTEADLLGMFSAHGQVLKATVVTDRETGRPKGFGFVEMAEHSDGLKAIEALAGQMFQGRPMTVNEARPRGSGTGQRVLGDGSGGAGGSDGADSHKKSLEGAADGPDLRAPQDPTSNGYRNTLLRR